MTANADHFCTRGFILALEHSNSDNRWFQQLCFFGTPCMFGCEMVTANVNSTKGLHFAPIRYIMYHFKDLWNATVKLSLVIPYKIIPNEQLPSWLHSFWPSIVFFSNNCRLFCSSKYIKQGLGPAISWDTCTHQDEVRSIIGEVAISI